MKDIKCRFQFRVHDIMHCVKHRECFAADEEFIEFTKFMHKECKDKFNSSTIITNELLNKMKDTHENWLEFLKEEELIEYEKESNFIIKVEEVYTRNDITISLCELDSNNRFTVEEIELAVITEEGKLFLYPQTGSDLEFAKRAGLKMSKSGKIVVDR